MSVLNYNSAAIDIRKDLEAAHRWTWESLARPGTWLTGTERVAVALEVRNALHCELCRESLSALSPRTTPGTHDTAAELPQTYIDVIHRVTNDPARLSQDWFESVIAAGLPETHYVEIVGIIGIVFSVDVFCRTLDIAAPDLPAPSPGAPTRNRPAGAQRHGHWVQTIAPEDLGPAEADTYANSNAANMYRALSLVPAEVRMFRDLDDHLYLPADNIFNMETDYRAIGHAQIELIAGRVSANNRCLY